MIRILESIAVGRQLFTALPRHIRRRRMPAVNISFPDVSKIREVLFVAIAFLILAILTTTTGLVGAATTDQTFDSLKSDSSPIYFEQNLGQFDASVEFLVRGSRSPVFLSAEQAVFVISSNAFPNSDVTQAKFGPVRDPRASSATAVYMVLKGSSPSATAVGVNELEHKTNYFIGNNKEDWRTDISNYERVRFSSIYDGIDLEWYSCNGGGLQPKFHVDDSTDLDQIQWQIEGANSVVLTETGDLIIKTKDGIFSQRSPLVAFGDSINSISQRTRFVIRRNLDPVVELGIELTGSQDPTSNEPSRAAGFGGLFFSTFLGGSSSDNGADIIVDEQGNSLIVGTSASPEFPTTPGGFDPTHNVGYDVFVAKMSSDGSGLLFSTYIGGSDDDRGFAVATDRGGNIYLTGLVDSQDYPVTNGALDTSHNGDIDAFVTSLNPSASELRYSTFVGGSDIDGAVDISITKSGETVISGYTESPSFPTVVGSYDTSHNGNYDVFVTRINDTGSQLVYSTFLGGLGEDRGNAMTLDATGDVVITGSAVSNFPTTQGAYDTTNNGARDGFVSRLSGNGSQLIYSTFVGANGQELAQTIALDDQGNAMIGGSTSSPSYPTTPDAFDSTFNGFIDGFVTVVKNDGSSLLYSTYIGGTQDEIVYKLLLNSEGDLVIAGQTRSSGFPTTLGAFDVTRNGEVDGFVAVLNLTGQGLKYSTFIGGSTFDDVRGMFVDSSDNVYICGSAYSADFPTTFGSFDPNHNGDEDAYAGKFEFSDQNVDTFDYDGDHKTDVSVYRPETGLWYLDRSQAGLAVIQLGSQTDRIAPADFDGDGKTDVAVFRQASGTWYVNNSSTGVVSVSNFGIADDVPAPGDYDGDGKADIAIYRPSTGTWWLNRSTAGLIAIQFGLSGDIPVPGDFDGDGKADLVVYRPSNGIWYMERSTAGGYAIQFGNSTDKLAPADYDGDGKMDVGIYRPSQGTWYSYNSSNGSYPVTVFGLETDIPTPGDYDGDGKADIAIFRPSNGQWWLNRTTSGLTVTQFGSNGDIPTPSAFGN